MKSSIRAIALVLCAAAIFLSALGSASGAEPSWHLQESQNGPGTTTANTLNDVSCPFYNAEGTGYCFAVGSTTASGTTIPVIEFSEGGPWYNWLAFGLGPLPSTAEYPGAVLEAISCGDGLHCMAVGYYTPKAGTRRPFAERWAYEGPGHWQIEKPAIPGTDEFTELTGVSCTEAYLCEAVGSTKATSGSTTSKTLTEKWGSSSWKVQTSASTGGVENRLTDVSCVSSTSCLAVGRLGVYTLSESYNGTEWKQVGGTPTGLLEGVSCTASNACTAVGLLSGKLLLVRRWNGTSWTPQSVSNPAGATLTAGSDVSCRTATECVLAGHYNDSEGISHPLAEHWNGSAWSLDSVPSPVGSSAATLLGVTCRVATLCEAVGNATLTGTKTLGEIYR
jgi:hypothetical protein